MSDIAVNDPNVLISPSDGEVIKIDTYFDNNFAKSFKKISIFLSPFDVHVNWIPIDGKILKVSYTPGKFLFAYLPKSSELNERNEIVILSGGLPRCCSKIVVLRQVAGLIARRIVCWAKEEEYVKKGQKFGMIKFGSRVDILIEEPISLDVKIGQKVRGGETTIGKWLC